MTMNKIVLALGTLLVACSGSPTHDAVAPTKSASACAGGSVQSDAELGRYAGCVTVSGDLDVSRVTSLESLVRLRAVDGSLVIRDTDRLYSLQGLENLRRVSTLRIQQNRALISVGSLNTLAHAEQVTVAGNPRLTRTHGFMNGLSQGSSKITLEANVGLRAEGVASVSQATFL